MAKAAPLAASLVSASVAATKPRLVAPATPATRTGEIVMASPAGADAGGAEAGGADAGGADAGSVDAGGANAGVVDAGGEDAGGANAGGAGGTIPAAAWSWAHSSTSVRCCQRKSRVCSSEQSIGRSSATEREWCEVDTARPRRRMRLNCEKASGARFCRGAPPSGPSWLSSA